MSDIFGKFPSFHDSEVHQINLVRGKTPAFSPTLTVLIHVFQMTLQVDEKNRYVLENHVLVEFRFSRVSNLEIVDFNYQNVLQLLEITETTEVEGEKSDFEVLFKGIFGVSAEFNCEAIFIDSVTPYEQKAS